MAPLSDTHELNLHSMRWDCNRLHPAKKSVERPTLHIVLPTVHQALRKLDYAKCADSVYRGEGKPLVQPSIYSRKLCWNLRSYLVEEKWTHPLLLVGCYLNPLFREIEFIPEVIEKQEHRPKDKDFAWKLVRIEARSVLERTNRRRRNGPNSRSK